VKVGSREARLVVSIALPAQADATCRGDDLEGRPSRRDESE
jgi:hypothetical protein